MSKSSRKLKQLAKSLEIPREHTVRYTLMMETQQKYSCYHNDLYCGHGRQPILQQEIEGGLEITLNCALDGAGCKRIWHKGDEEFDNQYCPRYKKYFGVK